MRANCQCPWCRSTDRDGLKRVSSMLKEPHKMTERNVRILNHMVRRAMEKLPKVGCEVCDGLPQGKTSAQETK